MAKKKAKKQKNENLYWLLGSLAAGAALVFITNKDGNGLDVDGDKGGNSSPSSNPPQTTPKPGNITTPEDTSNNGGTPVSEARDHVIIDSLDGETLYENYSDSFWNPFPWADPILKLENRTYIGKLTGRKHKIMREVTGIIEGKQRKYWVDENEVQLVTDTQKDELLSFGNAKQMHPAIAQKIDEYFTTV